MPQTSPISWISLIILLVMILLILKMKAGTFKTPTSKVTSMSYKKWSW